MKSKTKWLTLLLVLGLVLAACGGDEADTTTTAGEEEPTTTASAGPTIREFSRLRTKPFSR